MVVTLTSAAKCVFNSKGSSALAEDFFLHSMTNMSSKNVHLTPVYIKRETSKQCRYDYILEEKITVSP